MATAWRLHSINPLAAAFAAFHLGYGRTCSNKPMSMQRTLAQMGRLTCLPPAS